LSPNCIIKGMSVCNNDDGEMATASKSCGGGRSQYDAMGDVLLCWLRRESSRLLLPLTSSSPVAVAEERLLPLLLMSLALSFLDCD